MSGLRRGFKTEAERLAAEIRSEMGLTMYQRLDARVLAEHYGIPVVTLDDLRGLVSDPQSIRHFATKGRGDFSAMTVFRGSRRIIVENSRHSRGRRSNSVIHELAHVILEHEPHGALASGGCRQWDKAMEREADWLAGALLVPRAAAVQVARDGTPVREAAESLGVSAKLLKWRLNATGARIQARRERARWDGRRGRQSAQS